MKTINLTHSHKDLQFNILAAVVEGLSASGIARKGRFITYRSLDDSEFSIELWKSATKSENGDGKLIHRHTLNKGDYQMNDIRLGVTIRHIADQCRKFVSEIKGYQEEGLTLENPVSYPMTQNPEMMPDEYKSYDVLIDVDGWRKDFRVGYYHIDGDGKGHWGLYSDEKTDVKIDLEHARWTYPPLAARDKK